jgi:hypothetical protein
MASVEIHPAKNTAPISYDFINKTFLPAKVTYDKFDVTVNGDLHISYNIPVTRLTHDDNNDTYTGVVEDTNDQLKNKVKLKDILVHDKLRKQYYDAYIVNAADMYDGKNTDDYIQFVKSNPVLVDTIVMLANFQSTVAPHYLIEDLDECSQFLEQLRKANVPSTIPYKNIIKLHKQLIKICKMMEWIDFHVAIYYKNAKLNDIHAKNHISLHTLYFNNLYLDYEESGDDADQAYPIVGIKHCNISGKIIGDTNIRKLCIKETIFGGIEIGNHTIFGIYLDHVNFGNLITLPNCSQTTFICSIESKVDMANYKQMINFSKKHEVKIFNVNSFLTQWKKRKPSAIMHGITSIYLFNVDFDPYDTTRYVSAKMALDCDAFIISDDPKVEALKYEKFMGANNDLPREMMELFISLLNK